MLGQPRHGLASSGNNSRTKYQRTSLLLLRCPDFTYNENKTGSVSFPGATHKGFTAIANTLWRNGLRAALYRHAVLGDVTAVSVAGHSLGAGVAQLVAYATQVRRQAGCCCCCCLQLPRR
jgi:hypothetical protein